MTDAVQIGLLVVMAGAVGALTLVVWRVLRTYVLSRAQDHEFMLGVLERVQAKDLGTVVQAEAAREEIAAYRANVDVSRTAESSEPGGDENAGIWDEIDEGRAAMIKAGLDPNDPGAVAGWNLRHGGFQV